MTLSRGYGIPVVADATMGILYLTHVAVLPPQIGMTTRPRANAGIMSPSRSSSAAESAKPELALLRHFLFALSTIPKGEVTFCGHGLDPIPLTIEKCATWVQRGVDVVVASPAEG